MSQPAAVGGARFWTLEGYGIRAGAKLFNDDLEYYVFSSVSGKPGVALAHGHANVVSRVDQGLHNGLGGTLRTFEYTFAFETPFNAAASTPYFLGLHVGDSYPLSATEIYWATAPGPLKLSPSHGSRPNFTTWSDNGTGVVGAFGAGHLAFQVLDNVPEPTSLASLSVGAIVCARHRRCVRRRPALRC